MLMRDALRAWGSRIGADPDAPRSTSAVRLSRAAASCCSVRGPNAADADSSPSVALLRTDRQPVEVQPGSEAPVLGEDVQHRADPRHAGRVALRTQVRHLPAENVLVVQEGGDGEAVGRCSPSFT